MSRPPRLLPQNSPSPSHPLLPSILTYPLPHPPHTLLLDQFSLPEPFQQVCMYSIVPVYIMCVYFGSRDCHPAPPVANPAELPHNPQQQAPTVATFFSDQEPRKKKYAKEAWPGKKTTHLLL